jgi:predicted nucleotidyltransferase
LTADAFDAFLAKARQDPRVVGVFLGGSRATDGAARPEADYDLRVVVVDEEEQLKRELETPRGGRMDVVATTLERFRAYALEGSASEWDRYTFTRGRVLVDKLDGEIQWLVAEKARLRADEAQRLGRRALDAYLNSLYRALKSGRGGLALAARLHAAESVGHLLTVLFALEGRVRPFHDALLAELAVEPLAEWPAAELCDQLEQILRGAPEPQQALFRRVEERVHRYGLGDVIDSWEPDVGLMRGET